MTFDTQTLSSSPRRNGRGRGLSGAITAVALAMLGVLPGSAQAQLPRGQSIDSVRADGSVVSITPSSGRNPFALFASEDFACGSIRATGNIAGGTQNEGGPVANQAAGTAACVAAQRGFYFEMPIVGAAGPNEWRKIRAVYPNARTMLGSAGYSGFWTYTVSSPRKVSLGAADGQFGKTFSGVTGVNDGSCRGDVNTLRFEGFSMLATKDCPQSYGSEGYKGKLVVPDSVWRNRFNANPGAFRWDDWRIPATQLDATNLLGTNSLYSYMSDYYREQKLKFGSVVSGGTGTPSEQGFPLGIEARMDMWQFGTPSVRNTLFYSLTLVNKSADVYGTGVDYDSLYYGLGPGVASNQNANSFYFAPNEGTFYITRSGASGLCNGTTYPRRYQGQTAGCNSTASGFAGGVMGVTFLKSPLGDLRNKLFSQPTSPYFNPTNPNAGDTITYNHAAWGGFGNALPQLSMRSAWGQMSGIELDYLDGRTPASIGVGDYLQKWFPENFSGVVPEATAAPFNKFVPGSTINPANGLPFGKWDYNHDGIQDTLQLPGCASRGCHALWSDTMPGGYRNASWGNILNSVTAGPFKLKANDTTQFLFAFTYGADSIEIRTRMDAMLTTYYGNYAGPAPYPIPAFIPGVSYTITSAEFQDSTSANAANASVGSQITIRYPTINAVDQFSLRAIAKIRQDSINNAGNVRRVLRLNPGLLDRLTTRANDNLAAVYIFKTCDNGNTYTTTTGNATTCVAAPTRNIDAGVQAFAWRPVGSTTYTNGTPAAATFSEQVMSGRTYVYSFVTRSRGFVDIRVVDSSGAAIVVTDLAATLGITLDTISSALSASGPTTISAYAPITNAAGRTFARIDTSTVLGKATQDVAVTNVSNSVAGTSRLVYGNQFIVRKTIDTLTSAASTTVAVRYIVPSATTSPTGTRVVNFVAREQTFSANVNTPVRVGAAVFNGTQRSFTGSARVLVDTISAATNSMGFVWVSSDNKPIYIVDNQYATNFDRDEFLSPLFPGFTVKSRDSSNAATGLRQEQLFSGTIRDRNYVIRAPGDTVQANARQFAILVQPIIANAAANPTPKRIRGGAYTLTWQTDPWGPLSPFKLDPPQDLQATISSSLVEAAKLATTITDTSSKYNVMIGATTARPLVRVRVPFSMSFKDAEDGRVEQVKFAMLKRPAGIANTRLMGQGNDTIRVNVTDSLWLPGDTLYVLQKVYTDSAVAIGGIRTLVVGPDADGGSAAFRPIQLLVDSVGISKFMVACNAGAANSGTRVQTFDAQTCNPLVINSRGATVAGGYLPVATGWTQYFELTKTFDPRSVVQLVATPFTSGNTVTKAALTKVSVVPNPYIVRSDVDEVNPANRTSVAKIFFTGVPEQGTLRVYSVSGQFLQELTWTATDLTRSGNNSVSGDLPYNLRTREGIDLGSGLYFYVLTATGSKGNDQVQRGKFVIIR